MFRCQELRYYSPKFLSVAGQHRLKSQETSLYACKEDNAALVWNKLYEAHGPSDVWLKSTRSYEAIALNDNHWKSCIKHSGRRAYNSTVLSSSANGPTIKVLNSIPFTKLVKQIWRWRHSKAKNNKRHTSICSRSTLRWLYLIYDRSVCRLNSKVDLLYSILHKSCSKLPSIWTQLYRAWSCLADKMRISLSVLSKSNFGRIVIRLNLRLLGS